MLYLLTGHSCRGKLQAKGRAKGWGGRGDPRGVGAGGVEQSCGSTGHTAVRLRNRIYTKGVGFPVRK